MNPDTTDKKKIVGMQNMVEMQLRRRGISDEAILSAFESVPREKFVPLNQLPHAFEDRPLDIGFGATISQPYIVAKTIELAGIKRGDRVLEIGTGSGYEAALLASIGAHVFTIEIIKELATFAEKNLRSAGFRDVRVLEGDGYKGWPENLQFDAILLSAAPEQIPQPLLDQLKLGGHLVGPEGPNSDQWLIRVSKTPQGLLREKILRVRFVPMVRS